MRRYLACREPALSWNLISDTNGEILVTLVGAGSNTERVTIDGISILPGSPPARQEVSVDATDTTSVDGGEIISLTFDASGSDKLVVVVTGEHGNPGWTGDVNFPTREPRMTLEGPWDVSFDPNLGGPENITFETLKDWTRFEARGIQYYSGIATYRKSFAFDRNETTANAATCLDLGTVHDMARVRLNGQDLGVVWCAPWQIEVTDALKEGINQLEIEVANRWSNRLLGDQHAPDKDVRSMQWESGLLGGKAHKAGRYTFTTSPGPGELFPSGLIGPVQLLRQKRWQTQHR